MHVGFFLLQEALRSTTMRIPITERSVPRGLARSAGVEGQTKEWFMALPRFAAIAAVSLLFSGCASIAGSSHTMLTDGRILSESSAVLGYAAEDLTLVGRRVEGLNTYASLKAKDGREFTCMINGGNWLSMGLTNPPMCSRKGEPIKASPFQ
jgi:hypothetical protein